MKASGKVTKKVLLEKAAGLGIKNARKLKKTPLIHAIQTAEGHTPCFLQIPDCAVNPCLFRAECQQ